MQMESKLPQNIRDEKEGEMAGDRAPPGLRLGQATRLPETFGFSGSVFKPKVLGGQGRPSKILNQFKVRDYLKENERRRA